MKYRQIPHTAEMEFIAYGKTLKEAIENASEAMLRIMLDINKIKKEKEKTKELKIKEKARDLESLVWRTLQDILTKVDAKGISAYAFKIESINAKESRLSGKILYKQLEKDYSLVEIKAVTPYDLLVENEKGRWRIRIVVDV